MEPTITVLIGSPLSGDEACFLRRLHADLAGTEGIILANFTAGDRQIDFVVVTAAHAAAILELKNFPRPVFGEENGDWTFLDSAGQRVRYSGVNPYQQTANQKYALSDRMKRYQEKNPGVPPPSGRGFFQDFSAFVCIFPSIHPDSGVTLGDHKVAVRSYADIIDELRSESKASSWSLSNWRDFAQKHLRLSVATLREATDIKVYEAYEKTRAYRARVKAVFGLSLPPLIGSAHDPHHGQKLVAGALEPRNLLFVGPSGSAKTFHLHHLALALADSDAEIPIFVEAKKYRGGDFSTLLKQATAPLFRGDPVELLQAIRLCGARPVLILDALNECSDALLPDLIRGAQAFMLRFDARAVLTSHHPIELPADLQATPQQLSLPDSMQKRLIYSHHAGLPATSESDGFFEGFTNAYDLTLAGRCYQSGPPPSSRTDLYDRYVRRRLAEHTSVASALLRQVAGEMGKSLATAWSRDLFETTAERFLNDRQAPLGVLDDIRKSGLVDLTEDFFSFEHEILFNYFKADALRRSNALVEELATELKRPRNQQLVELVLPRYADRVQIDQLLSTTDDVEVLSRIMRGHCGEHVASALSELCLSLLDTAMQDVVHVAVGFRTSRSGHPQSLSITGNRDWTHRDAVLCAVVAQNLDHSQLKRKFLELLDSTEWKLRTASHAAARSAGFKVGDVWEETVRLYGGVLEHGTVTLPCSAILSALRMTLMGVHRTGAGLAIREALIQRTRKSPESHFALLMLLQDREGARDPGRVRENLQLVEQGLKSQIYIVQVDALEYLQLMHSTIDEQCPEELPRVRRMIEAIDRDNIMLNSAIVETLAFYDFLEPVVSAEDALSEVRKVISVTMDDPELVQLATMLNVSPSEFLASRAYGCLSRVFEDVFQGVYWDAYSELSDEEKGRILYLAIQSRDRGSSFDWILTELLRYGDAQALPAFQRFAAGVEDQCFVQETITCFALGMQGCALHSSSPPPYTAGDSPAHQAWQIVGEILYWRFKGANPGDHRFEELWARFEGPVRLAAADVLYRLRRSLHNWHFRGDGQATDLIAAFPEEIRPIVETCLEHRETLPSIFQYGGSRDRDLIRFLIDALGKTGGTSTIHLLELIVENAEFGTDSIRAIADIQKRAMVLPT